MKRLSLLLLFALAFASFSFGQLGVTSVTYTDGDIETDKNFNWYNGSQFSDCPGAMTVSIPVGAIILQTDVSYDMTSDDSPGSYVARQKSHFRCVSPGGTNEPSHTNGPSIYDPGTASYSRTGLDIANGVVGGGDVMFELHAGANFYKNYCSTDSVKVDNNTWTVTLTYIPAGFPAQALNPDPVDGGLYVGLEDDLSWEFGTDTETYDVYFGTDNPPTTKLVDNAVAGATGTFDPGTMDETQTYYWYIDSRNASGYTSGPVWSFTTICGAFPTPFTEDFEGVTPPDLPYCWTKIFNSTSTNAKLETRGYGGNLGPQCVQLSSSTDPDGTLIFITPMIDVEGGSLADKMVHFFAKGESFPPMSVGTMSDPTDESTFTAYETFYLWNDYQEYDIYLNEYVGTDTYIAFRLEPVIDWQVGYLDDITVQDMPTCIRPGDLAADNLTINSATLSWTDINGASLFNIEYGETGFTPTGTPTVIGVSNPHELTGLTSATEYDYYVQTDCGGGDLSQWSSGYTFMTPCDFYPVPFSENFDDWGWGEMPPCWSTIILVADGFVMNGNQGGYFQMQNGNDNNATIMLISPPVQDLAPNRLKFIASSSVDGGNLIIGTMTNPAIQGTFEELTTVSLGSDYQEYDVWLNNYVGTNNYFVFKFDNGSGYNTIKIDDISLEALPTCLPPADLFVNDITATTANFNWSESGDATDWEIEVGDLGFEPGTGTFLNEYLYNNEVETDLVYELTGLTSASLYDVYVRTDCGDDDYSPWTGPVSFITSFDAFGGIPVTEDFEDGLGITGNNYKNTVNWEINTDLQKSGTNSVANMYTESNDNVLFLLGTFDFTAKTDVMLSFWQIAKTDGNSDHCYVEISTDGGVTFDQLPESTYAGAGWYREAGQYAPIEGPAFDEDSYSDWGTGTEVPDNTWWKKEYFNLTDYNTFDNVVIRFRLVSNSYTNKAGWFIDDIAVEALGAPVFSIDPLAIDEEVTGGTPTTNVDLNMENSGTFPAGFTASVVYDEMDLINEKFNSGMPVDWTVVSRGTSDVTWVDVPNIYNKTFDGTPLVWADGNQSYAPVELTMDEDLISPVVDASAYADGTLQLEFDQVFDADYQPGDTARVYVYDGAEWIMIYEAWTDDGNIYQGGAHKIYDVAQYANANFQVKFNYYEGPFQRGRYFAIDNVRLRASMSALDWLTVDGGASTSGVSMPGDGAIVDVMMDGTGFDYGTYNANIEVVSDEPGKALTVVPVAMTVVPPAPPTNLVAVADIGLIDLTYDLNAAGDNVIIAYNTTDSFDQPMNGYAYPVGSEIGSNGTVIYEGSMTEFTHADLAPNTTFYYKAWSTVGVNMYSIEAAAADATTGDYQLICIPEGWSGISSYKVMANPALEDVLSGVVNEMEIMISNTGIFWPPYSINTIGNWNTQRGYKIKMNEPKCFTIVGDMLEDKTITVPAGSNYIPVLCDQPVSANELFLQFGNSLAFAFDINSQRVYWPEGGIFSLEVLEPGVGYLINMTQPGEATFLCEEPTKMGYLNAQKQVFENAPWEYTVTGSQHLISINKSAFADLEKGDFIGVFNSSGTCVGYTQYNGENQNLLLVAHSDDFTSDAIDGLEEGEQMSFRIFNQTLSSDEEVEVSFETSMPNSGSFTDMGRSMILKFGEEATSIEENITTNISIYPNPATDMVNISLNGDYSEATVVVYDTKGRAAINQVFNGQAEINVSSLEAGIYFVKINTKTISEIRKLVIK